MVNGKAQTPAHEAGYRIPINVKVNSQSLGVAQPSNLLLAAGGKNAQAAATMVANFGTSMFKPHSASLSVNSDNLLGKSNMSAFEAGSARRKRESKLAGK